MQKESREEEQIEQEPKFGSEDSHLKRICGQKGKHTRCRTASKSKLCLRYRKKGACSKHQKKVND